MSDTTAADTTAQPVPRTEVLDRAADALLTLAEERLWSEITLRDIAVAAGVGFAELYARVPGKAALLERLGARFDRAALDTAELEPAPDAHDRLFEAVMARLEAMEPHRAALIAIGEPTHKERIERGARDDAKLAEFGDGLRETPV